MVYAIIVEGHVADLIEGPRDCCIANLQLVAAPEGVERGWLYENGEFRPPPVGDDEVLH
jgi:hypothetical protein